MKQLTDTVIEKYYLNPITEGVKNVGHIFHFNRRHVWLLLIPLDWQGHPDKILQGSSRLFPSPQEKMLIKSGDLRSK